jgi:dimethylaniline monooxygenase (N-oxide forming)
MNTRVAVIGAGPSGLAAAKCALEVGLEPTVFEAKGSIGGLWNQDSGFVWPDMRTNLSKWTCSFSDFPWQEGADEFPLSSAVVRYLERYAVRFDLTRQVAFGERVIAAAPAADGWTVTTTASPHPRGPFAAVVVAAGAFARRAAPPDIDVGRFRGPVVHSGDYKKAAELAGKRVVVVGGSLSGIEVAGHLATNGTQVSILMSRPVWILPRHAPLGDMGKAPIDLMLYRRAVRGEGEEEPPAARNRRTATFFEATFGNPGAVHPALQVAVDGRPPYLVFSDRFLPEVARGAITPFCERLTAVGEDHVVTNAGRRLDADALVLGTGYAMDLSFLPDHVRALLSYDPRDQLMPFVAHRAFMHPDVGGLYFVGMYRGPYFGVIELQARWAAALIAGETPPPAADALRRGVEAEKAVRAQRPRPQYPHWDYVSFADAIAAEIGVDPLGVTSPALHRAVVEGPVIPAHYRLTGPRAAPAVAEGEILAVCRRVGVRL